MMDLWVFVRVGLRFLGAGIQGSAFVKFGGGVVMVLVCLVEFFGSVRFGWSLVVVVWLLGGFGWRQGWR